MQLDHSLRFGNWTSSQIGDLATLNKAKNYFGAPALSYIKTRRMERKLGRRLDTESSAKPTTWGKVAEKLVFELVDTSYKYRSDETIQHMTIPTWKGTPDLDRFGALPATCDVKCPFTLMSFCTLIDAWDRGGIKAIREDHKEGDTYYWQLVSNAILTGNDFAELIVFCPYQSQLDDIRNIARMYDGADVYKYFWLGNANDEELPYLIDGGVYKNMNVMRFEVPQSDKDLLTELVEKAEQLIKSIINLCTTIKE